ncbi:hypothetical protein [Leuconostoc falkenbergense]|uniref:hypothetical protein n=1 Tax=Leuconostoc falkenbergense TaxID=2766470 RepID=UPI0039E8543C
MTKPVAYIRKTSGGTYISQMPIGDNYGAKTDKTLPLYIKDQLHPRVKMTQAEFDEFKRLFEYVDYASMATATIANVKDDFNKLEERICSGNVDERIKKQNEFNVLWANYNPDNPDETIEIVPDMKWFVRSKKALSNGKYLYLENSISTLFAPEYHQLYMEYAQQFDTKEEAEQWTNPLTEAVQLPVEGDND